MDIFEFLVATIPVVLIFSIPLYAIGRSYKQKDKKLELEQIREQKELERLKQENFILENKQMQLELEKIKNEREEKYLNEGKKERWLIEDNDQYDYDKDLP